jgi:hypothetical protein
MSNPSTTVAVASRGSSEIASPGPSRGVSGAMVATHQAGHIRCSAVIDHRRAARPYARVRHSGTERSLMLDTSHSAQAGWLAFALTVRRSLSTNAAASARRRQRTLRTVAGLAAPICFRTPPRLFWKNCPAVSPLRPGSVRPTVHASPRVRFDHCTGRVPDAEG